MFGRHPDGTESAAAMDLVRLAIPRRTYTQSHIDYAIEVVSWVAERAATLRGLRIVESPPALRHFAVVPRIGQRPEHPSGSHGTELLGVAGGDEGGAVPVGVPQHEVKV